jgi:hypothetical protein
VLTGYFDVTRTDRPTSDAAGCLDTGGFENAFTADSVWLRVYENKTLPDPDRYAEAGVIAANAHRRPDQRVRLVGLNEVNNPFERTGLDPAGYRAWFGRWRAKVKALDATLECWWAGMSPGVPGSLAWYAGCEAADGTILHAYGLSVDELMALPRLFRRAHPEVRWMVGEANHGVGAGRVCDLNVWASTVLTPSLTECQALGCDSFLYFVYDGWTQDDASVGQATAPIARGTAVERVLRAWTPPQEAPVEGGQFLKRAYVHQFDQLGEKSVPEIAATLRLGGVTEVACKTHQELTWLGNATDGDTSPLAFRSLADVRARYEDFRREGIRMVPWCVPMGTKVAEEAQRAYDVAAACAGVIELDIEPYPGFWEGPSTNLTPYLDGILSRGARYEVNFDARETGWRPFGAAPFALACARAAAVWTQSYWTTFQRDAEVVVAESLATLALLEVPPETAGIIYPWDGAADYERVTRRLHAQVPLVGRIGMWKMGPAGLDVYTALAAIPTAQAPTPAPGFDVAAARDRLWAEAEELATAGYPWFSQGIKAAVAQNKGDR